jgi:hypothetical protein
MDGFTLEVTGASAATISDGVDVVAELTSGGDAPGGSYVATTYGETTYNGGAAFTLTGEKETGWPGTPNNLDVVISGGTAVGGSYTTTDGVIFVSDVDADWTITLNADGSAEMAYDGTVVALRASGPIDDPCGIYESTTAGEFLNPEFPELEEGEPLEANPFGTLTLEFTWSGEPDLDIGVTFLGETFGFGHSGVSPYVTWSGDNTTTGGPETVVIDLALAWDEGAISTFADVLGAADWYPPAGGSGPASLSVTYDLPGAPGTPVTHTLHPGSVTPATTPAIALRILADGSVAAVGADWTATVSAIRGVPREGVVYITITETAGAVSAVSGPHFATALPTSTGGVVYFPIATSNGTGGLKQLHNGALVWVSSAGGGSAAPFTEITEDDFIALGTPDADTYYDITDLLP